MCRNGSGAQCRVGGMRSAIVVGGGISGLSAAYFLGGHGIAATVVERRHRLGGVIRTDEVGGCLLEAGPDSWLAEKRPMLGLVDELGLAGEVISSNDEARRTFVVRGSRLVPLPASMRLLAPAKPFELLTTPLFGPLAKARMALDWLRRPAVLPERSVADFVRGHLGRQALERLAQPLLTGVYGALPEDLSADVILPQFVEYERNHGSILRGVFKSRRRESRGPLFETLKGGMGTLVAALRRSLAPQCRVVRDEALALRRSGRTWALETARGRLEGDSVILAVPAVDAVPLLETAAPGLAVLVKKIRYTSSVVAGLVYERQGFGHPLDGFGLLVPLAESASLAACTWVNTKFAGRAASGKVVLRAFWAGESAEDVLGEEDGAVVARAHRELGRWMGLGIEPAEGRASRWSHSMPTYRVGHRALVKRIEAEAGRHRGLYLGGNGFDGLGIPDCVRRSREIAACVAGRRSAVRPQSAGPQ